MIHLKRIYDEPSRQDGLRILVERLWPRGVSKEAAHVDLWLKDVSPSTELRKWYDHDPDKWTEFQRRYWEELAENKDLLALLKLRSTEGAVTFLFASKEEERNSAAALKQYLEEKVH